MLFFRACKFALRAFAIFEAYRIIVQALTPNQVSVQLEILGYGNPSMAGTFVALALVGTVFEPLAWGVAFLVFRSTPFVVLISYAVFEILAQWIGAV